MSSADKPKTPNDASPYIADDGTHVFPVSSIVNPTGGIFAGASGAIRWSVDRGLTFSFQIPCPTGLEDAPSIEGAIQREPGKVFKELDRNPAWKGTFASGHEFRLFSPSGDSRRTIRTENGHTTLSTTLVGQAYYGEFELPDTEPVAFSRSTFPYPRYFISGFAPFPWPEFEEQITEHGSRGTACLTLQTSPLLRIVRGECGVQNGAWIVFQGSVPEEIRTAPKICLEARRFISFLVGRSVPFLWTDRFSNPGCITRMYYGRPNGLSSPVGHEQPLPLNNFRDAVRYSEDVCDRLPQMFTIFQALAGDYDIDFISSPIWSAFDTYADDKLTFACVSLERLATAHDDFVKKSLGSSSQKIDLLTPEQGRIIKPALGAIVKALADPLNISAEAVRIVVEKKISNLHAAPNADKLLEVFKFLDLKISTAERDAIQFRNRTMHGRRTMQTTSLEAVATEIKRFDTLRTLINKAMLRLMQYDGPYIDYGIAEHPENFSIRNLEKRVLANMVRQTDN